MCSTYGRGYLPMVEPISADQGNGTNSMPVVKSYADTLKGLTESPARIEPVFGDDDVQLLEGDVEVDRSGPYPMIQFSERVHETIDRNMGQTVIVRMLGKSVGYRALWNKIHTLWKPQGKIQMIDLENEYYLIKLELESDYITALIEGPWVIFGQYLTVQPWSRDFNTSVNYLAQATLWIMLTGLPYPYYTKSLFRMIAAEIGKVIKVDYNANAGGRGRFARLAVVVDLLKPLLPCLGIDGRIQKLEYEGLPQICFKCGVYGHAQEVCGVNQDVTKEQSREVQDKLNSGPCPSSMEEELYGPWMVAMNSKRRPQKSGDGAEAGGKEKGIQTHARYEMLVGKNNEAEIENVNPNSQHMVHATNERAETHMKNTMCVANGGVQRKGKGVLTESTRVNLKENGNTPKLDKLTGIRPLKKEQLKADGVKLTKILPPNVLKFITAVPPPFLMGGADKAGWRWENKRRFTTKSAYQQRLTISAGQGEESWEFLTKYRGLPRIRMLLWLICKGRLLSNEERPRRHLTSDSSCALCGAALESISHILRDCSEAKSTWLSVLKPERSI
ncbi:hypothetical protein F3Y22_tig00110450pilonHSYRG00928 [Hibiscus syriacus]|uniref:CCHC-type domain-containing protein n=1 Tax=Hibiscus syriacus TaxID=106335 RepID=A0A6A3AJ40_HIBSY|nr:hypothetical protein F3Y22_tig00110450pilonHSYRG00928 [Hibiscus syriacus]